MLAYLAHPTVLFMETAATYKCGEEVLFIETAATYISVAKNKDR